MNKTNKNAATEDQLGKLHNVVTEAFSKVIGHGLKKFKEAEDAGKEPDYILDTKDINAAANWVTKNEIGYLEPENQEGSKLTSDLAKIKDKQKGKVLQFIETKEA